MKPACCRGKTPILSSNLTKDQLIKKEETSSLAEEELCFDHLLLREYWHKKKVQERKITRKMSRQTQEVSSLTDDSADEAEVNQGGPVALSNLAKAHISTLQKEDIPTLMQENSPTLKQEKVYKKSSLHFKTFATIFSHFQSLHSIQIFKCRLPPNFFHQFSTKMFHKKLSTKKIFY